MKSVLGGILLAFLTATSVAAQSDEAQTELAQFTERLSSEGDVVAEIGEMFARDQHARFLIIGVMRENALAGEDMAWFQAQAGAQISAIDQANTEQLKAILEQHTWTDLAAMQGRTVANAWKIVQHATHDLPFQQEVLEDIAPLVQAGQLPGSAYAQLYDRVALADGRQQRFGSQLFCVSDDWVASDLEDADAVDDRRAEFGLAPMTEYLEQHVSLYGNCTS